MRLFIITIIVFVVSLLVLEMIFYAYQVFRYPNLGKTRRRLKALVSDMDDPEATDLASVKTLSSVPFLDRLLTRLPKLKHFIRLQEQASDLCFYFIGNGIWFDGISRRLSYFQKLSRFFCYCIIHLWKPFLLPLAQKEIKN